MTLQATEMNRPVLEVADLVRVAETHSWPQILNLDESTSIRLEHRNPKNSLLANVNDRAIELDVLRSDSGSSGVPELQQELIRVHSCYFRFVARDLENSQGNSFGSS
jgi:hypothetical protein